MRVFRLQLDETKYKCSCSCCHDLGCISEFSRCAEDIDRSLLKMDTDLIDSVILPCFAPKLDGHQKLIESIRKKNKKIYQLTPYGSDLSLISLDDVEIVSVGRSFNLNKNYKALIVFDKNTELTNTELELWREHQNHIFCYFPVKLRYFDDKLKISKVYKKIKKMKEKGIKINPFPGLDHFEPRAPIDMEYEPIARPTIIARESKDIDISIIIPVFKQKDYLLRTLKHIESQDYNLNRVEVVIVDDGGDDHLIDSLNQNNNLKNLIYQHIPRYIHRTMGDFRFRAGIARNLGFRLSCGHKLLFLDADVLLPKNAISQLMKEIPLCDLLQIKRFDLTQKFTESGKEIEDINNEKDILKLGRDYWYDFFKKGKGWNELEDCWKYVCTYGLVLTRSYFISLGGFRTNYIGYGFEDTDFGYRLKQNGGSYLLSDIISYHQYHFDDRSEFKNSNVKRRTILSRTAKTFFLNNLDSDIYTGLRDYM